MERVLINENYEQKEIYVGYHDYHDHKSSYLNEPVGKKQPKYKIGVELETVFPSIPSRRDFCNSFQSNFVFMESDASLPSSGCEFITIPLLPSDATDVGFWSPLICMLSRYGVRSWGARETGLHVHISRTVFGPTPDVQSNGIGRLLYLYNYVIDADARRRIFGRGSTDYAKQLGESPIANATKLLKEALQVKEVSEKVCKELCDQGRRGRGYQINLTNEHTIEFRQGKGSVNAARVAAVCSFVILCCDYAAKKENLYDYSWNDFVKYIRANGNAELIGIIDQEG